MNFHMQEEIKTLTLAVKNFRLNSIIQMESYYISVMYFEEIYADLR